MREERLIEGRREGQRGRRCRAIKRWLLIKQKGNERTGVEEEGKEGERIVSLGAGGNVTRGREGEPDKRNTTRQCTKQDGWLI